MKRLLHRLFPVRIGSQIAVLVVVALIFAHIVLTATFFLIDPRPPHLGENFGHLERLVLLAKMMNAETDADARSHIFTSARRVEPSLILLDDAPPALPLETDLHMGERLQKRLGEHAKFFFVRLPTKSGKANELLAAIRLSDGTFLAAPVPPAPPPPSFTWPAVISMSTFLASALIVLTLWAARQLTAPLARFANAAERFTTSAANSPLVEDGPLEVRHAIKALNDMQQRVLKLVADRTRMLAAVGHDLRTPITRLRLRVEEVEPLSLREQIRRDLTTMQNLVHSALSFLRGEVDTGTKIKTDLPTLVQTVCDGFADMGCPVDYNGPSHLYVDCEPDQIMRAVENVIDNGLKFGRSVAVRVGPEGNMIAIEVQDDGPGIPDAEKPRVLEPFYRGDAARNLNDSDSFGLGLSIARSIVQRSGGTLTLCDAKPTGLLVRLLLPIADLHRSSLPDKVDFDAAKAA